MGFQGTDYSYALNKRWANTNSEYDERHVFGVDDTPASQGDQLDFMPKLDTVQNRRGSHNQSIGINGNYANLDDVRLTQNQTMGAAGISNSSYDTDESQNGSDRGSTKVKRQLSFPGGSKRQCFSLHHSASVTEEQNRLMAEMVNINESRTKKKHMASADLYDSHSPTQHYRAGYKPSIPKVLLQFGNNARHIPMESPDLQSMVSNDQEEVERNVPCISSNKYLELRMDSEVKLNMIPIQSEFVVEGSSDRKQVRAHKAKVGVILSGGPAPGGHNVIIGIYELLHKMNPDSKVIGFMGGIDGFFQNKTRVIDSGVVDQYRNSGGFDMLWSGRGRFRGVEDFEKAAAILDKNDLTGLVIIGGDGSNSNAAILSNYLRSVDHKTCVIGVPKTIDGDLKSKMIECSFGFDTCSKTYSELIGNLATDIGSSQQVYHIVRVMGRAASHLVLECALQTRPNMVVIGEEVKALNLSLADIVGDIADLVIERRALEKRYGMILVPEGLIEFIPEVQQLITELNTLLAEGNTFEDSKLSEASFLVWDILPDVIKSQLLGDREATGYIQVAKIQTERLLILMVEAELMKRDIDATEEGILFMPHYFGYEGRCAMPSNFDCNFCHALGMTAGTLILQGHSGYMATVRYLDQPAHKWQPAGIPFSKIMHMKQNVNGEPFIAVVQQLVNMDDPLILSLNEVRQLWRVEDVYRCPGPIQFDGPASDVANMTVMKPSPKELLWSDNASRHGHGSWVCTKREGQLSLLQKLRLNYHPITPDSMRDINTQLMPASDHPPQDPYAHRQILMYYPLLASRNLFHTMEVQPTTIPANGQRMGLLFLSRQSPGIMNILWGMYDRCQQTGGQLFGFYGMDGLVTGKALEISAKDLHLFANQGGCELLGRSGSHRLLYPEVQRKVFETCRRMQLDGLVIVGSNLALTEAAMLSELFLELKSECKVIGVPATGSNNLIHPLLETNIGFDTSSKVYANLIGNVLTEAASMPKYWHFIRLLGRAPSYEVLECALQTHPNMVIIAEEYGSAQKTLGDVVNDIADVVCARSDLGKNFGTVLIPDGLLWHLPGMKQLLVSIAIMLTKCRESGSSVSQIRRELANCEGPAFEQLSGYNKEILQSLAYHIRKAITRYSSNDDGNVETEVLLSQMVGEELNNRKSYGKYNGSFQTVKHFFGYQGRSAMPSQFDANLSYAYGKLAAMCVESNLTGHCCSIRGLCGPVKQWKPTTIPFTSMLQIVPAQQDVHHELYEARKEFKTADVPIIPSSEVSMNSKAFRWMKTALFQQWMLEDRYCNPGPIQYHGAPSLFTSRSLFEEQSEYYHMLKKVQQYTDILKGACQFGVDGEFLRSAFMNLNSLIMMRFFKDDFTTMLPDVSRLLKEKSKTLTEASAARETFDEADLAWQDQLRGSTIKNKKTGLPRGSSATLGGVMFRRNHWDEANVT